MNQIVDGFHLEKINLEQLHSCLSFVLNVSMRFSENFLVTANWADCTTREVYGSTVFIRC